MMKDLNLNLLEGCLECTDADLATFDECFSLAVPFTAHWENLNDDMKVMQWDNEWEKYIKHRAELIDADGRESYLPWNLYRSLGLQWLDGYNYTQRTGDCCSKGHKNSAKMTALTNARRAGKTPTEIAASMTYAIARGNGRVNFGSGLNLNPMSKWAATIGNFWAADFGKYDTGAYTRKYKKGSQQDKNALKTQSVLVYLPSPSFDLCYAACAAGFGIHMGTGTYPTGASVGSDSLAVASSWKNGGHAMAFMFAIKGKSGKRYIYLENSHGARYAADSLSGGQKQHGLWIDETAFRKLSATGFRYANGNAIGQYAEMRRRRLSPGHERLGNTHGSTPST